MCVYVSGGRAKCSTFVRAEKQYKFVYGPVKVYRCSYALSLFILISVSHRTYPSDALVVFAILASLH